MTPIEALLRKEIRANGPRPFHRFMEQALYHPRLGYYRRAPSPLGKDGDFCTSSQVQPVFGRLLARQIERWRHELGDPEDFTVVELGAGRGETLRQIEACLDGTRCLALERDHGRWPEHLTGVVLSNEFFDNLPVHAIERRGHRLVEWYVDADARGLCWRAGPLSEPLLRDVVETYAPGLADGQRLEVGLAALSALRSVARHLERGVVLSIDYGYTADEIDEGRFPQGTLMSYRRHRADEDVLRAPGEQDVTAHVNWTALRGEGRRLGLRPCRLERQGTFLTGVGEDDLFADVLRADDEDEALRLRLQLKTLLLDLGEDLQVLVQRKD